MGPFFLATHQRKLEDNDDNLTDLAESSKRFLPSIPCDRLLLANLPDHNIYKQR